MGRRCEKWTRERDRKMEKIWCTGGRAERRKEL